jgi:hypothetical protein
MNRFFSRKAALVALALSFVACEGAESGNDQTAAGAAPTAAPSRAPDAGAQGVDTPPTTAPSVPPTDAPSEPPTDAPSEPPTDAPAEPPTDAPAEPPTDAPTAPPTAPPEPPHEPETNVPDAAVGEAVEWRAMADAGLAPPHRPPPVEPPPPEEPAVDPFDPAPPEDEHADDALPTRPRRRMDIDQLDRTIRRVMGGMGWTEVRNGVEVNLFVDLAATLGKPDYVTTTYESLDATPTFQKFLNDAARSVCDRRVTADAAAPIEQRVVLPNVDLADVDSAAVDRTLMRLLLRTHGRRLEFNAPGLRPWRWLFDSSLHVTQDPLRAWETVCVGLLSHPDFYTY